MTKASSPSSTADVCLIVEGCYPYVPGGVSSWVNWLMRSQPQLTFSVTAIMPLDEPRSSRYEFPDNMSGLHNMFLHEFGDLSDFDRPQKAGSPGNDASKPLADTMASLLIDLFEGGGLSELRALSAIVNDPIRPLQLADLMNSPLAWNMLCTMYERTMPQASFHHYYWAWRALLGGLFSALKFTLPPAKLYHTIATGYAGLVAARANIETGRPALITEHGIYTNERRIEILMAEWIADTVDKGLSIRDERYDLRDMWINAFESYARTCYQACSDITTLYEDNQRLQRPLMAADGSEEVKLEVIANGIDYERFAPLKRADDRQRPTMALIGRVVPIKDVKTFISAAHLVHQAIPDLDVLIMGPTDEDEDYFNECAALVEELGLQDVLEFTGNVQLTEYMPRLHVIVLSSLSEAQPLVLLEAGAAGVPCIATDVGSCREIIEGRSDEVPRLGLGGIVTGLVAPDEIAAAVRELLEDEEKRRLYGDQLQARVEKYYITERSSAAYSTLYGKHLNAREAELKAKAG